MFKSIFKKRFFFLIFWLVGSGLCLWQLPSLEIDSSIVHTKPVDAESQKVFLRFQENFADSSDRLLIALVAESSIWEDHFWQRVKRTSNQLEELPQISSVQSPLDWKKPIKTPTGLFPIPIIRLSDSTTFASDSVEVAKYSDWTHSLIGKKHQSVALRLGIRPRDSEGVLKKINGILEREWAGKHYLIGKIAWEKAFEKQLEEELSFFFGLAILLMVVLLTFFYRNLWGVLLPLLIVASAIIWTLGLLQVSGYAINALTVLLPTILLVVGISDSVHFMTHYMRHLADGKAANEALQFTSREIGRALLLTSLTTATGFLSLLVAPLPELQQFGLFTALGVMLAFGWTVLLMPLFLSIVPVRFFYKGMGLQESLDGVIKIMLKHVSNYKNIYLIALLIFGVWCSVGSAKLQHDRYLLDDLSKHHTVRKEAAFFSENFGGIRKAEVWLQIENPYSWQAYKQLALIDSVLKQEAVGIHTLSALSAVRLANDAYHHQYAFPDKGDWRQIRAQLPRMLNSMRTKGLKLQDKSGLRLQMRLPDIGAAQFYQLKQRLFTFSDQKAIAIAVTGKDVLADQSSEEITKQLIWGLVLAIVVIALAAGIFLRSLKLMLLSIVPNVLPLLGAAALMGWMQIPLSGPTAMIFSISLGIAVDDTIHFLSKYQYELKSGKSTKVSLYRTLLQTGKAITLTSLFLGAGFAILMFSGFQGTVYMGMLVSFTIFFALLLDLFLLPYLLKLFNK